jgi:predicted nucleotidyltransferase/HEPN domain-containing protein
LVAAGGVQPDQQLVEMANWLAKQAQAEEVLLFGSRARGTHHDGSDADFLVVMRPGSTREAKDKLSRAVQEFNKASAVPIQAMQRTGAELCDELSRPGPGIAMDAMKDAVLLYPSGQPTSRYTEYARVWTRAYDIKVHFFGPARHDIYEAHNNFDAGNYPAVPKIALQALMEALSAALRYVGGDQPEVRGPSALVAEIEAHDAMIGRILSNKSIGIDYVVSVASLDAGQVTTADLRKMLDAAQDVVDSVEEILGPALDPDTPCPSESTGEPYGDG